MKLVIAFMLGMSFSQAQSPVICTPAATFDLARVSSSQERWHFSAIALGEKELYVTRRDGQRLELLTLTRDGTVVARLIIESPGSPLAAGIDREGGLFLLAGMRDRTTQLHRYSVSGDHRTTPLISAARSVAVGQGGTLLLNYDGTVTTLKETGSELLKGVRVPPDSVKLYDVVAIDTTTLAIVHRYKNELRLFHLQSGAESVIAVDAPEVKESIRRLNTLASGAPNDAPYAAPVLFHAVAPDGNGNLLLGVSPGSAAEGMRLVQLDREGRHLRSLRLRPATVQRGQNSSGPGLSVQRHLSVAGSTIATLTDDGVVSVFAIPTKL